MMMEPKTNRALVEKVEILKNILISRAQYKHQESDEKEYPRLRIELLAIPAVAEKLPRFVRTCRSLSEFWDFIRANDLPTYQSRRVFIRENFGQLLDDLEIGAKTFSEVETVEPKANPTISRGPNDESVAKIRTAEHKPTSTDIHHVPVSSAQAPATPADKNVLLAMKSIPGPIDIFFSYAHEDVQLMHEVRRQFVPFERQGLIRKWYDRMIRSGTQWKEEIDTRLVRAQIVLLFVSPHFFESDYCYEAEMREALKRHKAGLATVVPIILSPCAWHGTPLGTIQALPTGGKPITTWPDRDQACLNVAEGVMEIVRQIQ